MIKNIAKIHNNLLEKSLFYKKISRNKIYYFILKPFSKIYNENLNKEFNEKCTKKIEFNGIKFEIILDPQFGLFDRCVFVSGTNDKNVLNYMKNNIKNGDTVLDIGANIGYYSIFFSKLVGTKGKVHCFEPSNIIYKRLSENLKLNKLKNIQSYHRGCGNKEEEKIIYLNSNNYGGSTLNKKVIKDIATKEQIKIIKIDDLKIGRVSFVKIDVESFELEVLLGMKNLIKKSKPKIILEFSYISYKKIDKTISKKILEFLFENNYNIKTIQHNIKVENVKEFLKYLDKKNIGIIDLYCEI